MKPYFFLNKLLILSFQIIQSIPRLWILEFTFSKIFLKIKVIILISIRLFLMTIIKLNYIYFLYVTYFYDYSIFFLNILNSTILLTNNVI